MIRIGILRRLERRDVRRLVPGYDSREAFVVRRFETRNRVVIRLERVRLRRAVHKRYPLAWETWARYRRLLREGTSLGAFDGQRLVGLALAERRAAEGSLFVWELGVAESHRRQGIGTLLLRELTRRAQSDGLRIVVCETQTANTPAIDFYRRNGFRLDGVDLSEYSNDDVARGEVALFMKKHVGPGKATRESRRKARRRVVPPRPSGP